MGYLDEVGLEHLWGKAKGRFGMAANGSGESVTAESASKLKGLTVHGKSVQDGTPTPSAPVEIRSVKGRNLLVQPYANSSKTQNGVTFTVNADYSLTIIGTATAATYFNFANHTSSDPYEIEAGTYTLGMGIALPAGVSATTNRRVGSSNLESFTINAGSSSGTRTFTASGILRCYITVASGATVGTTIYPMLERGSTAHDYQPYGSITLVTGSDRTDIDLQGHALRSLPDGTHDTLTVDAGGNVSMVQRVMVRNLGSWSFSLNSSGGYFYHNIIDKAIGWNNVLCSAYKLTDGNVAAASIPDKQFKGSSAQTAMFYKDTDYSDAASFKAAMDGVYIYYALAEPVTVSLGTIDMPELQDGDTIWVDAEVTPSIDAEWWTGQAEFKTINGESILGDGNIQISGSGTIDSALSDTSANAVQNKVIKAALEALIAVETLYDSSTITVKRSGRTIMVQVHGVSVTPSTSTAVLANVLADYKPDYNISTTVLTSSGGSTQAARMVVYASDGGVYIVPAGYSSSASWYGTLTYIY